MRTCSLFTMIFKQRAWGQSKRSQSCTLIFFLYPKNKTAKNVESKTLACNNFIINTKRKDS